MSCPTDAKEVLPKYKPHVKVESSPRKIGLRSSEKFIGLVRELASHQIIKTNLMELRLVEIVIIHLV